MKGVIFNLAEEVVSARFGDASWDQVLDTAGLDGAFTSLGNYPDSDLVSLVSAASTLLDVRADEVIRMIGSGALPLLAERYPAFFTPHISTRPFLLTLNEVIHAEVRKLYPNADVPEFEFDTSDDTWLAMRYTSHRQLCALAEGFVMGAAAHYGEEAVIEQPQCMHDGADSCLLRCRFTPVAAQA
ncbi:MAG: heme NO-binding domain-containing protein [Actinomycetota bacterium]|nr:heme NO-binding domain-containing protein [Actinomycetota bacterium]